MSAFCPHSPVCALALVFLAGLTGCISTGRESAAEFPLGAEVEFLVPPDQISAVPIDELVEPADQTVQDRALTTGAIRTAVQGARPAVLSIYTVTETDGRLHLLPLDLPFTGVPIKVPGQALGSGFFIHPDGYLLTNRHVVRNAREIRGLMVDGSELKLQLLAVDPTYDLALLKAEASDGDYPFLPMGRSEDVEAGEMVLALGNPLGLGDTATLGILSSKDRDLMGTTEGTPNGQRKPLFLQTDTAINPGSSGGPLITLEGAWIGVNTAVLAGAQGIGFSMPSHLAEWFLDKVAARTWKAKDLREGGGDAGGGASGRTGASGRSGAL